MKANSYQIVKIILRIFQGKDTKDDRVLIDFWKKSNQGNVDLLESFRDANHIEKDLVFLSGIDEERAWKKIDTTRKPKIINNTNLIRIASVLVLILGISFFCLKLIWKSESSSPSRYVVKADVKPAQSGAVLLLADGTVKSLGSIRNELDHVDFEKLTELNSSSDHSVSDLNEYNTLVVPKGNFYKLNLEDGTQVWVNANSKLQFPVKFGQEQRRVILEGEAYFEVSHDVDRPFSVLSKGNEIKVLGTHFNVNAYRENVRTTLATGKVQVTYSGSVLELNPGEYAHVGENGLLKKGKADLEHDLAWHYNQFCFKQETIVEISSMLAKWYDVKVKIKNDVPLDKVYSGNLKRSMNLTEVLDVLTYVCDLEFVLKDNELLIGNEK